MTIHPAKTELMLLSRSNFIGPLQNISLGPNQLNFVTKSTSLGVQIDNKLTWSYHIKSLCKRFRARLKKLKHLKGLDKNTLETIYFKGILPSVTYSISVWGSSNSFQALEDIHIRAARFIHNKQTPYQRWMCWIKPSGKQYRTYTRRAWLVLPIKPTTPKRLIVLMIFLLNIAHLDL